MPKYYKKGDGKKPGTHEGRLKGEKDQRMSLERRKQFKKDIDKAGDLDTYLKEFKRSKAQMFKYKNKYYNKNTPTGKAILAKVRQENS